MGPAQVTTKDARLTLPVGTRILFATGFGLNTGRHTGRIRGYFCYCYDVEVFLQHWGYTTSILATPDQIERVLA